jgi:hypothetical protein
VFVCFAKFKPQIIAAICKLAVVVHCSNKFFYIKKHGNTPQEFYLRNTGYGISYCDLVLSNLLTYSRNELTVCESKFFLYKLIDVK